MQGAAPDSPRRLKLQEHWELKWGKGRVSRLVGSEAYKKSHQSHWPPATGQDRCLELRAHERWHSEIEVLDMSPSPSQDNALLPLPAEESGLGNYSRGHWVWVPQPTVATLESGQNATRCLGTKNSAPLVHCYKTNQKRSSKKAYPLWSLNSICKN